MRLLLRSNNDGFSLTKDLVGDDIIPPYAILSHTWLADTEEATFEDLTNGTGKDKPGYEKLRFCGEQARQDGLQYFWIDTCCINKTDYGEVSRAINSMFCWYRNASRCYVYLPDVSISHINSNDDKKTHHKLLRAIFRRSRSTTRPIDTNEDECDPRPWESDFRKSRWFTRGWTLQELLAPASVEFFSRERQRLGDKVSLKQQIHEITGIDILAIQGEPLSQFSREKRFSWISRRETKFEEDKVYSLLGIFGVYIHPDYGEGKVSASKRLREEIDKLEKCIQDSRLTDPRDDKKRIEETKGGLLEDSYHWILENAGYLQWRHNQQSHLLWIKGDPGKGKTMLLCGIINELKQSIAKADLLSYFFCQATDSRINNATAVLRGLMYMLVSQQPSLVSHIRKKHDHAGKTLFEDANAWIALSEIFIDILQDPNLNNTYLIVDALDECVVDLPKLLNFIVQKSFISARVKWIVSSRNWPEIEDHLQRAGYKVRLCLELNAESISTAVSIYIQHKVHRLAQQKGYDDKTQYAVLDHLSSNANDTFLWVALVCQSLEKIPRWNVLAKLNAFPPGLDPFYERMMIQLCNSDNNDLCKSILASIAVVYRPITLKELTSLVKTIEDMIDDAESLSEMVGLCGSFLTIREGTIYFVHQSAKDYLITKAFGEVFPSGMGETHHTIFSRSLQVLSKTLRRDIYSLQGLGYPIERVKQPDPDPLAAARYSCVYWIDHLLDWNSDPRLNHRVDLQDGGTIDVFLREKYLYWLEALSLCRSMSQGVRLMAKLEALIQRRTDASLLVDLVRDTWRFIMYHKGAIENSPLQAYGSALLFSPVGSVTRRLYKKEEPKWITIKPGMEDKWSACLQTLEGHSDYVLSVAFSPDSARLASGSGDKTVKIWDARSGECLQTLKGHSDSVWSVAFSPDSAWLASGSLDNTVKIWDARSGECLQTLDIGKTLYSVSFDTTGLHLHTDIGTIAIAASADSNTLHTVMDPKVPQCQGAALSSDGAWMTYDSEKLIWLPSEYRPSRSAVSGKTIGVGVGSGKVWICHLGLS